MTEQPDLYDWQPLVDDLERRQAQALAMGGEQQVERQRGMGKLPVRERLDLLLDPGSFVELGQLADSMDPALEAQRGYLAADGMVAGIGAIDGRRVAICAYDFTVLAGSMGAIGETKTARVRELALRQRIPIVWLLDSAGARIQSSSGSTFAAAGALFREQVTMSGVVPQVAAMLGHCAAGTAYIPALADFVPMVKGTSSMALGGRHLVRAATGEDVTEEEMGGSEVHTKVSGVADLEVASDAECLEVVRRYLSFFPSHNQEAPPVRATSDPVDRRVEELYRLVPTAPRRAYDMTKVVPVAVRRPRVLPDQAGLRPQPRHRAWGASAACPSASSPRNPMVLGGALDVNAADKAARFVWLCDAFGIPLVFLHDVPGFIVGSAVEKQGIIRHGAKMLFAVSEATVPKVSVVLRKSYGAGYFVMNGTAYEADYVAIWPTAEVAVMGPDGMVEITQRKVLDQYEDPKERGEAKVKLAEEFRKNIDPYIAAGHAAVDAVIDPADTRFAIWQGPPGLPHQARRAPLAQARRPAGVGRTGRGRCDPLAGMGEPYLTSKLQGFGTTIFAEMSALAVATGPINLGQGFPDTDGPDEVREAALDAIAEGRGNQYPPGPGIPELRAAIAAHQQRCYGIELDPDSEVLVTAGATEAIAAALLALLDTGDEVVAFEPYYDCYAACIAMAGAGRRPVTLRPPDFALDARRAARRGHAPHPAAPAQLARTTRPARCSTATSSTAIAELAQRARPARRHRRGLRAPGLRRRGHVPIAPSRACASAPSPSAPRARRSTFTGWKVGWATGPAPLVAAVRTAKQFLTYVQRPVPARRRRSASRCPTSTSPTSAADLQRKRDRLVDGLERGRPRGLPPAGHVLRHRRHPPGAARRTAWRSAGPCPSAAASSPCPNVVFYDDVRGRVDLVRFAFCKRMSVLEEAVERLAGLGVGGGRS